MSRLTKKKPELNIYVFDRNVEYANFEDGLALLQIIGKLEDLMEKYGIESIEELEDTIKAKKALELAFGKHRGQE